EGASPVVAAVELVGPGEHGGLRAFGDVGAAARAVGGGAELGGPDLLGAVAVGDHGAAQAGAGAVHLIPGAPTLGVAGVGGAAVGVVADGVEGAGAAVGVDPAEEVHGGDLGAVRGGGGGAAGEHGCGGVGALDGGVG